jgi:hypothetical protein
MTIVLRRSTSLDVCNALEDASLTQRIVQRILDHVNTAFPLAPISGRFQNAVYRSPWATFDFFAFPPDRAFLRARLESLGGAVSVNANGSFGWSLQGIGFAKGRLCIHS